MDENQIGMMSPPAEAPIPAELTETDATIIFKGVTKEETQKAFSLGGVSPEQRPMAQTFQTLAMNIEEKIEEPARTPALQALFDVRETVGIIHPLRTEDTEDDDTEETDYTDL